MAREDRNKPLEEILNGDTSLKKKLDRMFHEKLLSWVERSERLVLVGLACIGVRVWSFICAVKVFLHHLWNRPEIEFVIDLVVDVGVAVAFSWFLKIFADKIVHGASEDSIIAQFHGGVILDLLEVLHWTPLVILFIYQVANFLRKLHRDWNKKSS